MPTETDFARILEKLEQKIEAGQAETNKRLETPPFSGKSRSILWGNS